ncbi:zinc finger protein 425-like [Chrysoperla carnea]|uniref:zinc finger protein 425-like n=1 Tax=Chrysoperla carnea TaxID=189513 RepID=UPI001D069F59|nr:zinc finger protein 425-like [Chrysoperla carnea]
MGDEAIYECNTCHRRYVRKSSLLLHKKHKCGQAQNFSCELCEYKTHYKGKRPFKCDTCTRSYMYRSGLYLHKRYECGKDPMFSCHLCTYRAHQRHSVKRHLKIKHNLCVNMHYFGRPFFCSKCNRAYKHKWSLVHHCRYECGKEPSFRCNSCDYATRVKITDFPCSTCPRRYKYRTNLLNHLKYECGKDPKFSCHLCTYRTKHRHSVKRHLENIHNLIVNSRDVNLQIFHVVHAQEGFTCNMCSKIYKYLRSLQRHQKYECGKSPSFQCPHCEYACQQKANLKKHVIFRHCFACNICSKIYKYRCNLSRHQKYECGKSPSFKCPHCEYACQQKANLKKHVIFRHSGKPPSFRCPECAYTCHVKANLKSRMICFSCNICSKIYKYRRSLQRHQKYECGKSPSFQCPYCEYACHVKANLKQHVICRHSGKSPSFQCPYCEYVCPLKSNLKMHVACRHSKIYE